MVLHQTLEAGAEHLLLLLDGAGRRGERVALSLLGGRAVGLSLILFFCEHDCFFLASCCFRCILRF